MDAPRGTADSLAEIQRLIELRDFKKAAATCYELLQHDAKNAPAWYFLAVIAGASRDLVAAESALRKALELNPAQADYWDSLSITLVAAGRWKEAEDCSLRAISLEPRSAHFRCNLGNARYVQKRWPEAAADYRQSLAIDPNNACAWLNLGAIEHNFKHFAAAQTAYENSLRLAPDNLDALINLAFLLCDRGQPRAALELVPKILSQDKNGCDGWIIQADAHADLNELAKAEAAYRHALQREPTRRQALHNLATILVSQDRLIEAEEILRQLLKAHPSSADAQLLKSKLLLLEAEADAALATAQQAVANAPTAANHSKLVFLLPYCDKFGPDELLTQHRRWNDTFAEPLFPPNPPGLCHRFGQPLRVGLVSADFKHHPTAHLSLAALELLDRNQIALTCYSDLLNEDGFTARFRSAANCWQVTAGLTDEELADQIRRDEIDILLDLAGHVAKRLLVFARKPAPVQGDWLGYVGTTGLRAIDFLLGDRFHIHDGEERFYSEQIVRLPHDYICFSPPDYSPAVSPLPALQNGYITFGCFNNVAKFSPRIIELWSQILRRVPGSKLLLKYNSLTDRGLQARLLRRFADHGVDQKQILFAGRTNHAEHLAAYNRVDLALDTQPYSGGLTTCEALWMGVPTITFPGNTFASRHSASHLANSGNYQFIARDASHYVDLAVAWANSIDNLARLRAGLRDRVRNSPLCDAAAFARDLTTALKNSLLLRGR